MKLVDKYYYKIYKQTSKLTKKLFGEDIVGCLKLRFNTRSEIEKTINKSIHEITSEDIIKNKLGALYCRFRTLDKILEVIENACVFKTFTIEEFEENGN